MKELGGLRRKIDVLDEKILGLLNERARIAVEIGRLKRREKVSSYLPERERAVLNKLSALNTGPFPADALRAIYREVISASRSLEEPLKIAYLGPLATFAHQAAMRHFGSSSKYVPVESTRDVFEEVDAGRAAYGVVPIENSNEGIVSSTLDLFVDYDLVVSSEVMLEISQNLLSKSGAASDVRRIYSHPQGIAQCREWLEKHMPRAVLLHTASTAKAAEIAAREKHSAAIASEAAARMYDLKFIAKDIGDRRHNFTRFLVIGRQYPKRTGRDRTSITFSIKDRPGALYGVLEPFKKSSINLTRIESRPSRRKAWEYIFFVDMEGHIEDRPVKRAIEGIKKECVFVKVLGSYPRMDTADR